MLKYKVKYEGDVKNGENADILARNGIETGIEQYYTAEEAITSYLAETFESNFSLDEFDKGAYFKSYWNGVSITIEVIDEV